MTNIPRMLGGRYEVGDLIGRGGMAQVHIGYDTRLSRTVAIKVLRSDHVTDQTFVARFRREAQSAAALNHPSIVAVYDTGEEHMTSDNGTDISLPYIVMEYVKGRTVSELLKNGDALPINEAVQIAVGILSALEYSHREGIVHRDIKPGNIMLTNDGKVKVMDFGIARALADSSATMTQTNSVVGTAQYLSPEQARGEVVDSRSDLYSTGCLLYELLTGRPPFRGDSAVAVAYQHVSELPASPMTIAPDIPENIDRVVMKALAKKREDRYQRAIDMRSDLLLALRGSQVTAPASATWNTQVLQQTPPAPAGSPTIVQPSLTETGISPAVATEKKNNTVLIVLGVILLILAVTGLGWALLSSGKTEDIEKADVVIVPDLEGTNQVSARQRIEDIGLVFVLGEPQEDKDIPEGKFVSSDPAFGTEVKKGSSVTVSFSSGAGSVTIPDLATGNFNQDAAKRELEKLGLKVGRVDVKDVPGHAKDVVTDTLPAAGQQVERGTSVNIVIASGEIVIDQSVTSRIIGQTREAAEQYLNETLKISSITIDTEENQAFDEGTISRMDPTPGKVPYNTKVTLWVAKKPVAPPPAPTPAPSQPGSNNSNTTNPDTAPTPPPVPPANSDDQP
ncbi:Stk1 family PASTA domain-containing Ser/Thr kinase [Arcanobacterium buesumense]|uniref:non-specific serine/threonine protein kinase n=1 Tax=Arcanobacterium buesumense TaxID=2722751 RepID=A0A6H2EKH2_9ACTO|nr:Stk1 family PASTA domain-containing Ser/Thr kinase [Arcanobacterium buesumense]QJC21142.1 Stk1 family PASTA domain-containing Ser/Thr kinase [Arcanobacterium buesumense]